MGVLPHRRRALLLAGAFVLASASIAAAGPVTLAWDASAAPDIAGYELSYGTSPATYTTTIDVGNVTTWTLDLPDGFVYYFAVRSYNSLGERSDYSSEVFTYTPCTFTLSSTSASPGSSSGSGSVGLTTQASCTWTATSSAT